MVGIICLIVALFVVLMTIDNQAMLAPLWTAIAFPAMVISPFVILVLKMPGKVKAFLIVVVLLLIIPALGLKDSFYFTLVTQIGIFAAMALGLNIVVGFAGLLDLGYIAFFAVGAYLWGVFTSQTDNFIHVGNMTAPSWMFYLFVFFAIGAAALAGILLGLPVLRLRGDYLAIVTLGFGEMVRILFNNLDHPINITNGPLGLNDIAAPPLPTFVLGAVKGLITVLHLNVENPVALAYQFFFYFLVL